MVQARTWLAGASSLLALVPLVASVPADKRQEVSSAPGELSPEAASILKGAGITPSYTTPSDSRTAVPASNSSVTLPPPPRDAGLASAISNLSTPALLPPGTNSSNGSLPQDKTNGGSALGTLQAPKFDPFISGGGTPIVAGTPWGNRNTTTNYYKLEEVPVTGVTRTYQFTVGDKTIAPDGVERPGLVINGQFPGPTIEANWGDWISVTVTNNLPDEGTSLHWHGFLQKDTPYYDGVPSVMQCPIAPGSSFTYRFRADLYGTSWYHSHYSAQYAGGASGAMVIHGPNNTVYDEDLGPIILSDWYHDDYEALVVKTMGQPNVAAGPPLSDNILINGKNNYACNNGTTQKCSLNAGLSKFQFKKGKKHRLRLINASADATLKFSIDNHSMSVFANDFVQIEPYTTDVVTLGVGQRSDVIVEGNGEDTDAVWMRAVPVCSATQNPAPQGLAYVYYEKANVSTIPTTQSSVAQDDLDKCANDDLSVTIPVLPIPAELTPSVTQDMVITFAQNSTGYYVWQMNGQSFRGDFNDPILLETKLGKTEFDPFRNVYNFGSNSTIRLIVKNTATFAPHPMHWHGHNMQILFDGHESEWDGSSVVRPSNPQRRDTQLVQKANTDDDGNVDAGVIVLQIEADNPGVWPVHCHIAWHVSAGLYINVIERPADIEETDIPMVVAQTCRDWWAWSGNNIVDQIDSGL